MSKVVATLFLTLIAEICSAQEGVSALYSYSMLQYQPSFPASDDIASISLLSKRTYITSALALEYNSLMLEFPLRSQKFGRRFGGIGLFVSEKNAGASDILKSTTLNLSMAYNVDLSRRHCITFGLQPSYIAKRTSLDQISTGSQWLASEFRFDPNADVGETFLVDQLQYFTFHSGVVWSFKDKAITNVGSLGVSVFDLNKPNQSFTTNQNRIAPSLLIEGELSLVRSNVVAITPKCFIQIDPFSTLITGVLTLSFPFSNRNPFDILRSGSVCLSSNYTSNNQCAVSVSINQPAFSFAFGYVFPVGTEATDHFRNGGEVGLKILKNLKRNPSKAPSTISSEKRVFNFNKHESDSIAPVKSDIARVEESIADFSDVKSVLFELDEHFKFGFGSSLLTDDAKKFLDELSSFLQRNPKFKVEIVGHTDNVGKPVVNYRLSTARAKAVEKYLVEIGVAEDRVKAFGAGDTQPLAGNATEEERSKNRRVHFKIYVEQ